MSGLSERQQKILDFIKSEIKNRGYPPSVREIGIAVGLRSSSTVHGHLAYLQKNGYIRRDSAKPRAIEVIKKDEEHEDREIISIPIVGEITAGEPIFAEERIEDMFPLPADFIRSKETFMLNVEGDSMVDAGILDGDLLIVKKQDYAENGNIVVALLEDEATVKRFYKENNYIRLQPENKYMDPIYVTEVSILGVAAGLVRRY